MAPSLKPVRRYRRLGAWLLALVASGIGAYLLVFAGSEGAGRAAPVPQPEMVVLTNQPSVTASYSVSYYRYSFTSPGQSTYGPAGQAPVGSRMVDLSLKMPPGVRRIRFALLLNRDASVYNATAPSGFGTVDVTAPGSEISSLCQTISGFHTAQVLSGLTPVDTSGQATIKVLGGVPRSLRYPEAGDRVRVNVLTILPPTGDGVPEAAGETSCSVQVPDWEQIGGYTWHTPILSSGHIDIGDVPPGDVVESANPPVDDPTKLDWVLQGPPAVSYTLLDVARQAGNARLFFFAGILAALATSILIALMTEPWRRARREDAAGRGGGAPSGSEPGDAGASPDHRSRQRRPLLSAFAAGAGFGFIAAIRWVSGRTGRRR